MKYLHDNNIIHRDLKPENLLLDQFGNVKICDFGWCVQSTEERQTFCGTLDYMAPEMILEKGHSFQLDLWAIGVLLYELLHGYPPFRAAKESDKCQQILIPRLTFDPKISPEAIDLIKKLLKTKPQERLSLNQVLSHPWIAKYTPPINISVETRVKHYLYGFGTVKKIEGLLCSIFYSEKSKTQYLAIPDMPHILEIQPSEQRESFMQDIESIKSIDSEVSTIHKEKRLLQKFHKWCKTPIRSKNKLKRKIRISISLKHKKHAIYKERETNISQKLNSQDTDEIRFIPPFFLPQGSDADTEISSHLKIEERTAKGILTNKNEQEKIDLRRKEKSGCV